MKLEWSVGAATFERLLSLRIRYSMEKATERALSELATSMRTSSRAAAEA
jgi:hypothetical protein